MADERTAAQEAGHRTELVDSPSFAAGLRRQFDSLVAAGLLLKLPL